VGRDSGRKRMARQNVLFPDVCAGNEWPGCDNGHQGTSSLVSGVRTNDFLRDVGTCLKESQGCSQFFKVVETVSVDLVR